MGCGCSTHAISTAGDDTGPITPGFADAANPTSAAMRVLSKSVFAKHLTAHQLLAFAECFQLESVPAGHVFHAKGQPVHAFHLLVKGDVYLDPSERSGIGANPNATTQLPGSGAAGATGASAAARDSPNFGPASQAVGVSPGGTRRRMMSDPLVPTLVDEGPGMLLNPAATAAAAPAAGHARNDSGSQVSTLALPVGSTGVPAHKSLTVTVPPPAAGRGANGLAATPKAHSSNTTPPPSAGKVKPVAAQKATANGAAAAFPAADSSPTAVDGSAPGGNGMGFGGKLASDGSSVSVLAAPHSFPRSKPVRRSESSVGTNDGLAPLTASAITKGMTLSSGGHGGGGASGSYSPMGSPNTLTVDDADAVATNHSGFNTLFTPGGSGQNSARGPGGTTATAFGSGGNNNNNTSNNNGSSSPLMYAASNTSSGSKPPPLHPNAFGSIVSSDTKQQQAQAPPRTNTGLGNGKSSPGRKPPTPLAGSGPVMSTIGHRVAHPPPLSLVGGSAAAAVGGASTPPASAGFPPPHPGGGRRSNPNNVLLLPSGSAAGSFSAASGTPGGSRPTSRPTTPERLNEKEERERERAKRDKERYRLASSDKADRNVALAEQKALLLSQRLPPETISGGLLSSFFGTALLKESMCSVMSTASSPTAAAAAANATAAAAATQNSGGDRDRGRSGGASPAAGPTASNSSGGAPTLASLSSNTTANPFNPRQFAGDPRRSGRMGGGVALLGGGTTSSSGGGPPPLPGSAMTTMSSSGLASDARLSPRAPRTHRGAATAVTACDVLTLSRRSLQHFYALYGHVGIQELLLRAISPSMEASLRQIPFMAGISDVQIRDLAAMFHHVPLDAHEILFREGELDRADGNSMFFLAEGVLNIFVKDPMDPKGERDVLVNTLGPGHFIGEVGLLMDLERTATITAREHCVLLELRQKDFRDFVVAVPDIVQKFKTKIVDYNIALKHMIKNPFILKYFIRHCETEYSTENIEFWMAARDFRTATHDLNERELAARARELVTTYVVSDAPKQVNVDGNLQATLLKRFHDGRIDRAMFVNAEDEILRLMSTDSYGRFTSSLLFKQCLDEASQPYMEILRKLYLI